VDSSTLDRFADIGFAAVPGGALRDLAAWCCDYCEATGDARYCAIGRMLLAVDEWWSQYDESGGVPSGIVQQVETLIRRDLPAILGQDSPADAGVLARLLRQEVTALLVGPERWPLR
jgi:hypothetical protein